MKSTMLASLSALLLLSHTALASPVQRHRKAACATYTTSFTTYIADYTCGTDGLPDVVLPGNITSGVCVKFRGDSYLISPVANATCTFNTFNGDGCVPADVDLSHTYPLAPTAPPVCAYGGVPDGGLHYLRSGLLTCA